MRATCTLLPWITNEVFFRWVTSDLARRSFVRPEQCPAGLTGLFPLSTWACTLDLLHILQHVHIHTAHVDQLTHTHVDHYTHSWSQQHPAELCSSLYTRSSCVQLSYILHHCSATCVPSEPKDPINGLSLFPTHFNSLHSVTYTVDLKGAGILWLPTYRNAKSCFWTLAMKIAINYECIYFFTGYLLLTIMLSYLSSALKGCIWSKMQ